MDLDKATRNSIVSALKEALKKLEDGGGQIVSTDIYLQPMQVSGELVIYNDDDDELAHVVVPVWKEMDASDFYSVVEPQLATIVSGLEQDGALDPLSLLKPYSFVLVDEDHETLSELLLVDDDTMLVSESLLNGLDDELDEFLKKLLEE